MGLSFYKILSVEPAAAFLAKAVSKQLKDGKSVLWLVPGGSSIAAASLASRRLEGDTSRLTIGLTDERYGQPGHPDSNWQQLIEAGFDFKKAKTLPVLYGQDLETTAGHYASRLEAAFRANDYKIGFFGVGADGHLAGIKPGSPALNSQLLAAGYEWDDFTRLTMTPKAIRQLDEAIVYMIGKEKWPVLDGLDKNLPTAKQPVQVLKDVPVVTIFNDNRGEEL